VMDLILVAAAQRGDGLLQFGGVIREVLDIQLHEFCIAEA
jgi:hypothetical protein